MRTTEQSLVFCPRLCESLILIFQATSGNLGITLLLYGAVSSVRLQCKFGWSCRKLGESGQNSRNLTWVRAPHARRWPNWILHQKWKYYVQRGENLFELSWEKFSARLHPATAGHARLVLNKHSNKFTPLCMMFDRYNSIFTMTSIKQDKEYTSGLTSSWTTLNHSKAVKWRWEWEERRTCAAVERKRGRGNGWSSVKGENEARYDGTRGEMIKENPICQKRRSNTETTSRIYCSNWNYDLGDDAGQLQCLTATQRGRLRHFWVMVG